MIVEDASSAESIGRAVPTPPEISEEIRELRAVLSPAETVRVLDDFSRWLFTTAAAVASLGAAFGASGLNALTGWGRGLFSGAILSLALSLAFAAAGRAPRRARVIRVSRESMRENLDAIVAARQKRLFWASIFFSIALVLAGLAPLVSQ